jgi:hypothetical protein
MTTLPSLHEHINQSNVTYGPKKLALMQQASRLMETPLTHQNVDTEGETISKLLRVKLFNPCGSWTWYVQDWDGTDVCFGWVQGTEPEWGYFSLQEISEYPGTLGIGIEIDTYFTPVERNLITDL